MEPALGMEIRNWERFENRRQIASYTGLSSGITTATGVGLEGSIGRVGFPLPQLGAVKNFPARRSSL
jgi:hypothetical protein